MEQFKAKKFEQPRDRSIERETENYKIVGQSDVGKVRENNEDNFFIGEDLYQSWGPEFEVVFGDKYKNAFEYLGDQIKPENQEAFKEQLKALIEKEAPTVLCDGMGGHGFGECASSLAGQIYFAEFLSQRILGHEIEKAMAEALKTANQAVYDFNDNLYKACDDPKLKEHYELALNQELDKDGIYNFPAGTTLTAQAFDPENETVHLINVGDSRGYYFNLESKLKQLTNDHTVVEEKILQGMDKSEAKSKFKGTLSVALGVVPSSTLESVLNEKIQKYGIDWQFMQKIKPRGIIILCSDGLTDMLEDPEIAKTISQGGEITENLVEQAKTNGGHDNITVIATRFK